jgi:hypothetical protein
MDWIHLVKDRTMAGSCVHSNTKEEYMKFNLGPRSNKMKEGSETHYYLPGRTNTT